MNKEQAAAIWPVMKAFAEGKRVQSRRSSHYGWSDCKSPTFIPESQWRVAPEKREIRGWVNVYPTRYPAFHLSKDEADDTASTARIACVEVRGEYEVPADQ